MKEEETKKEPLPGIMGMCAETLGPGGVMKKKVHPDEPRRQQPSDGEIIREIDTSLIDEWEMVDRPVSEFGDMDELTGEIRNFGQRIPALVRPKDGGRFELIYGRRRLAACRDLGIKLKAVAKKIDDQEAFLEMFLENQDREDISSWAKAQSYKRAIEAGVYPNQSALAAHLSVNRATITKLMAYTEIPENIAEAIGPMTHVGVKTAVKLAQLARSEKNHAAIIANAERIAAGKLSDTKLEEIVLNHQKEPPKQAGGVINKNGIELASWNKVRPGHYKVVLSSEAMNGKTPEELDTLIQKAIQQALA